MNDQANTTKFNSTMNPYLYQQIQTASPEKLILMLYDLGIQGCHTKDRERSAKVLVELISALNFEHRDMAIQFYDLYKFALDQVHKQNFDNALMIFQGLREVWETAVMKKSQEKALQ